MSRTVRFNPNPIIIRSNLQPTAPTNTSTMATGTATTATTVNIPSTLWRDDENRRHNRIKALLAAAHLSRSPRKSHQMIPPPVLAGVIPSSTTTVLPTLVPDRDTLMRTLSTQSPLPPLPQRAPLAPVPSAVSTLWSGPPPPPPPILGLSNSQPSAIGDHAPRPPGMDKTVTNDLQSAHHRPRSSATHFRSMSELQTATGNMPPPILTNTNRPTPAPASLRRETVIVYAPSARSSNVPPLGQVSDGPNASYLNATSTTSNITTIVATAVMLPSGPPKPKPIRSQLLAARSITDTDQKHSRIETSSKTDSVLPSKKRSRVDKVASAGFSIDPREVLDLYRDRETYDNYTVHQPDMEPIQIHYWCRVHAGDGYEEGSENNDHWILCSHQWKRAAVYWNRSNDLAVWMDDVIAELEKSHPNTHSWSIVQFACRHADEDDKTRAPFVASDADWKRRRQNNRLIPISVASTGNNNDGKAEDQSFEYALFIRCTVSGQLHVAKSSTRSAATLSSTRKRKRITISDDDEHDDDATRTADVGKTRMSNGLSSRATVSAGLADDTETDDDKPTNTQMETHPLQVTAPTSDVSASLPFSDTSNPISVDSRSSPPAEPPLPPPVQQPPLPPPVQPPPLPSPMQPPLVQPPLVHHVSTSIASASVSSSSCASASSMSAPAVSMLPFPPTDYMQCLKELDHSCAQKRQKLADHNSRILEKQKRAEEWTRQGQELLKFQAALESAVMKDRQLGTELEKVQATDTELDQQLLHLQRSCEKALSTIQNLSSCIPVALPSPLFTPSSVSSSTSSSRSPALRLDSQHSIHSTPSPVSSLL